MVPWVGVPMGKVRSPGSVAVWDSQNMVQGGQGSHMARLLLPSDGSREDSAMGEPRYRWCLPWDPWPHLHWQ